MKNTLYIYCRVSSEKQVDKYSLPAQEKLGIKKAKELDFDYKLYVEKGKSAAKDTLENRPEINKIIDEIVNGKCKNIYVTELDRLTRNETTNLIFKKYFKQFDVSVYTEKGIVDYSNYESEMLNDIMATLSRFENQKRVARSVRGMQEAILKGKTKGGMIAWGYSKDKDNNVIIDEYEKKIYLEMIEMSLKGIGTNSIARILTERGIPTKSKQYYKHGLNLVNKYTAEVTNKPNNQIVWKANTVLHILKNSYYYGVGKYNGVEYKTPAIISKELFDKVQLNLKSNFNMAVRNCKHNYLLKGILFCKRCGSTMIGLTKENRKMFVYQCMSKRPNPLPHFCGMKNINQFKLESLVWNVLISTFRNSKIIKKVIVKLLDKDKLNIGELKNQINNLKKELASFDFRKTNIITLYSKNLISDLDVEKQLANLQAEREIHQSKIDNIKDKIDFFNKQVDITKTLELFESTINQIKNFTFEKKRKNVLRFIERITIDYIDAEKEHCIEISLKFPLFENSQNKQTYFVNLNADYNDTYLSNCTTVSDAALVQSYLPIKIIVKNHKLNYSL